MSKQGLLIACTGLLGGALASVAYQAGTARATVPVAANRLFYSGQLLNGAGALTGAHAVQVEFFSAATNGLSVCGPFMANSNPINGQFSINTSGCDDDFKAATNVFVQLTVDPGTANAILIPPALSARPRVGAVPFATQAERADVSAAVTGDIPATQITISGGQNLQQRLNELALKNLFCGETTTPVAGNIGGYAAADVRCRTNSGCGNLATVHMCTADEMLRSARLGITLPVESWYSAGVVWFEGSTGTGADCNGWTTSSGGGEGPLWTTSFPNRETCNNPRTIACCDLM